MKPHLQRLPIRLVPIIGLWLLSFTSIAAAQTPLHLHGQVRDTSGHAAPGATISADGPRGQLITLSDANGRFALDYPTSTSTLQWPHPITGAPS